MIRSLNWFDMPMSLANGRIAKVTFEKGAAGDEDPQRRLAEWKTQQYLHEKGRQSRRP